MASTRYGLAPFEIVANPNFRVNRNADGLTSATRTFSIRKEDKENPTIQSAFSKGAPLINICPDLGGYWGFLQIQSHEMEDLPGGFTEVYVTATGYTETGDYDFDKEVTYSLAGLTTEKPITEHPKFIETFKTYERGREGLTKYVSGQAYSLGDAPGNWQLIDRASDTPIVGSGGWVSAGDSDAWFRKIVEDGRKTYIASTYEWTRTASNAGGLSDSDLEKFAKRDPSPKGSPPEPSGSVGWWLMSNLSDERSSNASMNSITWQWQFGEPDTLLYD